MSEKLYTLEEAKELLKRELRSELNQGKECPVCTQFAKVYKRPLYSTIAYNLMRLYWLCKHEDTYYHISRLQTGSGGGDFAKLLYWEFVEEQPKDEEDKTQRTSGMWRITERGIDFVNGDLKVPSHVKLYDGRFLGLEGEEVGIQDVLGKKYDYEEIMSHFA